MSETMMMEDVDEEEGEIMMDLDEGIVEEEEELEEDVVVSPDHVDVDLVQEEDHDPAPGPASPAAPFLVAVMEDQGELSSGSDDDSDDEDDDESDDDDDDEGGGGLYAPSDGNGGNAAAAAAAGLDVPRRPGRRPGRPPGNHRLHLPDGGLGDGNVLRLTPGRLSRLASSASSPPPPTPQSALVDEDPQTQSGLCRLLPDEVLLQVLGHLSIFQLFDASLACKRFCRLSRERSVVRADEASILVEGFRSCQNYDPLIRLQKGGFSQKKMLLGPVRMKSLLEVYNKEVGTLVLGNCVLGAPGDAVTLLHWLQRVRNLRLFNIDMMCHDTRKVFLHCFDQLQQQDKLHLDSIRLDGSVLDNPRLLDLTAILPFAVHVDLGSFWWSPVRTADRLAGFVDAMAALPKSRRRIRVLSVDASSSAAFGGVIASLGRLAGVFPRVETVDLRRSSLGRRALAEIVEAITECEGQEDLVLSSVRYGGSEYGREEFVRVFRWRGMTPMM